MDSKDIRQRAAAWMISRGWKRLTAKRGSFNQSLFEHTIYELDALLILWPILSRGWGLQEQDLAGLIVGTVAHDVGKETEEWQRYVLADRGTVPYTSHVIEDLTQSAVDALFDELGLSRSLDDAKAFVRYHMQATKTTDSLIFDVINKGDKNNRWMTLSTIIAEIDNVCSAKGLFESIRSLERTSIGKHVNISYHLVQIRGVSTILLHRAAIEAFQNNGWSPLLHYSNGTIYICSSIEHTSEPQIEDIESRLAILVEDAMGKSFASAVVTTSFLRSSIAMPPLFDYREVGQYLTVAGSRVTGGESRYVKRLSTPSGKPQVEKLVRKYLTLAKGHEPEEFTEADLVRESQRISRAHPEMCIFKFFKAAMDSEMTGEMVNDDAQSHYSAFLPKVEEGKRQAKVTPQFVTQIEYDRLFGQGAFASLRKTSTLMPARDMAYTIDKYWSLPGHAFGLDVNQIESAPDSIRQNTLIDALTTIADRVYAALPPENRPTRAKPREIAHQFAADLLHPSTRLGWPMIALDQLTVYGESKLAAKSPRGQHFCPICNMQFGAGSAAKADYLDKPESHTNRGVSHGSPGYIVICPVCKYERFLQNLLLGGKPAEILVLVPRMNIGQGSGAELVQKALELSSRAMALMSNDNPDPNQHISLSLTQMIARKLSINDVFTVSPQALVDLFTYSAANDKRKEYRKALEEGLREELLKTVEDLNDSWGTEFADWDLAIQALIDGKVRDSTALAIRAEAFKLHPSLRIVCQTPHLILLPLLQPMSVGKDAEVNAAIRRLFTMLVLSLSLDCTVAVLNSGDSITFQGGEGVVRVPRVSSLRDLIGGDWIGLDHAEKWLRAIGAASLIAQATGLPESSNLYQILCAPTPGHILRRIEQQNESGAASFKHLQHLETLKEVLQ